MTTPMQKADQLAKQRHPDLYRENAAAARAKVWAESPDLRDAHAQQPTEPVVTHEPAPVEKGAPALVKRDAAVRELRKLYPEKSHAELRVMALQENPDIYDEYRRLSAS